MKLAYLSAILAAIATCSAKSQDLKVEIVGTGDGLEILRALAENYSKAFPNIRVDIPASIGSGGGIAAVAAHRAELGRVARKLSDAEREGGIVYIPIAKMPSTFFAHPSAKVRSLTSSQLADIFAGNVVNWKEVGGADLRIRVIRREDVDSTLIVLRKTMPRWEALEITRRSKMATSTQEAIETAQKIAGAIGFAPYETDLGSDLVVLKIDDVHPLDKDYPSQNELALIHRDRSVAPWALEFVKFSLSEAGQRIIIKHGGLPALQ